MAREFGSSFQSEDSISERMKPAVSRVAQLMVSIPDKAPLGAPTSLSSQYPYFSSAGNFLGFYIHKFDLFVKVEVLNSV